MFITSSNAVSCYLAWLAYQSNLDVGYATAVQECIDDGSDIICLQDANNRHTTLSIINDATYDVCCTASPFC